ncbi:carbohydrate sulfotransferase 5-like [Hyperolius riggenbachi]|uniref:carbohydrate sulfotransferase 5-like n=1 Tax=Hyperolius riggenbachi TaxID=752182 RepID=UPI0035A30338
MGRLRIALAVFAVVGIFQTILLFLNLNKKVPHSSPEEKPKKVHLLILSTWRAGSSLVGQFFSQHPDVFFLKEPTWHVWKSLPYNNANALHMAVRDLIRSVFRCDMSVFDAYIETRSHISNVFHWGSSRALCSPPSCSAFSRKSIISNIDCEKHCRESPFSKVEESCHTYSHVVLQDVRILDLKVLHSLLKDSRLNLKILHIVRDPRAVGKSRDKIQYDLMRDNAIVLGSNDTKLIDKDFKVLEKICQSQVDIFKNSYFNPPPFLKDRYLLIRYEDVVRETLKTVKEMYDFAGLELTQELISWVQDMTHGPKQQKLHPFVVSSRDALSVSQAWRSELPYNKVKLLQKICRDAVDAFRYQNIGSEDELKDLTLETVLPMRKEDFKWED